jgi:hypothetical protein
MMGHWDIWKEFRVRVSTSEPPTAFPQIKRLGVNFSYVAKTRTTPGPHIGEDKSGAMR